MRQINDLMLRMQPYHPRLKEFCLVNSEFAKSLKSLHAERFVSLGAIVVSQCPLIPEDEIIGFYVYDYGANPKIFKQDFIVNVGCKNQEFIIYTRFSGTTKSKNIRDISHFYNKYPTYPKNSHHPKFEELPKEIQPRALQAINLANRIIDRGGPVSEISDEEYTRFDLELKKLNL